MSDQSIGNVLGTQPDDPAVEALSYHLAAALQIPHDDGSDWGSMHELALLYVALMHRGRDRDQEELEAVYSTLGTWYPEADDARIEQVVRDALLTFISDSREQMLDVAIEALHQSMPRDQRIAILSDLFDLALAEGFIVPAEAAFIERLAQAWDIEQEVS